MTILGIDTSTAATSVCLLRGDGATFEVEPDPAALTARPAHSAELMPAVANVMERAEVEFAGLDAIAVGVGPGAFTGLRIGVVTARALAQASARELRPVSSLSALAAGIDASLRLPVIDARRGEVFASLAEDGHERWEPFVGPPDALAARVGEAGLAPLAAGDGAVRFRDVLEAAGIRVEPESSRSHVVRALHVCRLALDAPAAPPEAVLPHYLRLPDAKPTSQ